MSLRLFTQCVDQIAEMGIPNISLSPINGEPLVDPGFFCILAYLNRYSFQVTSITNAIMLEKCNDEELELLLSSLKQLRISMAPNPRAYRTMYRVDKFSSVVKGLSRLQRKGGESACDVVVNIRLHTEDSSLSPELQDILDDDFFSVVKQDYPYKNWGGSISELPSFLPFDNNGRAKDTRKPCILAARPSILSNGKVSCCTCADYDGKIVLGDTRHESLAYIIYSQKRRRFLQSFIKGTPPSPCDICSFYAPHPTDNN
jgi:MoaA/NifB/PqqE/SkfB family radical SAM enzyme